MVPLLKMSVASKGGLVLPEFAAVFLALKAGSLKLKPPQVDMLTASTDIASLEAVTTAVETAIRDLRAAGRLEPHSYQLLSDVDDTLFPNPFLGVGGVDVRPVPRVRGGGYPGVSLIGRIFGHLPVLLVSGAPRELIRVSKAARALEHEAVFGGAGGDLTSAWALLGAFATAKEGLYRGMALRKARVFYTYSELLKRKPGAEHVKLLFLGDDGQGDVEAAMYGLECKALAHAFIHKVHPERREEKRCRNLHYFCDYAEMLRKLEDILPVTKLVSNAERERLGPETRYADKCRRARL